MSYATLPSHLAPDFAFPEVADNRVIRVEFESGDIQMWPKWRQGIRKWTLQWNHATKDQAQELRAFFLAHLGPLTPFYISLPDTVPAPAAQVDVEFVQSGRLAQRTLVVAKTWAGGASKETDIGDSAKTVVCPASHVLRVKVGILPRSATGAYIYVGTSVSDLHRQGGIVTDQWTEPDSGYDTGGAAPPSSNNFTESPLVNVLEDSISFEQNFIDDYTIKAAVIENPEAS